MLLRLRKADDDFLTPSDSPTLVGVLVGWFVSVLVGASRFGWLVGGLVGRFRIGWLAFSLVLGMLDMWLALWYADGSRFVLEYSVFCPDGFCQCD